jgi:fatty-acid peroxygenase
MATGRWRHIGWRFSAAGAAGLVAYAFTRRSAPVSDPSGQSQLDETAALRAEGYAFVGNRWRRHGSDVFATRLMCTPVVCAVGEEAARAFYTPGRFTRRGTRLLAPTKLLQAVGSVQTLEGRAHEHRKRMFVSVLAPERVRELTALVAAEWRSSVARWERESEVVLHAEVRELLCRAVCAWAGVPLPEADVARRTRELTAIIDAGETARTRSWAVIATRSGPERWIRGVVDAIRGGSLRVPHDSAASVIASHRDEHGRLLGRNTAAVELINVLRPTIAAAGYIVFAAMALHDFPEARAFLDAGADEDLEALAQEVRRYYPFVPVIGGRALQPFEWQGRAFCRGDWMLLDIYGTDHDHRAWEDPEAFRPGRFRGGATREFALVAQGAGGCVEGHRCPGEPATIELIKTGIRLLTTSMRYEVPPQETRVDLTRVPALPYRFTIANVRRPG